MANAESVVLIPSYERIRSGGASPRSIQEFLAMGFMPIGLNGWDDHFQGDTLHGGYQSTASGAASVAAAISTGAVGGAILLDAGTDNGGRSDLSLGLHYTAQRNAVIWARVQLSAIGSVKCEIGFTDVISGTDAGAVNVKATPTFNANDFVGWVIDTTNNANWEGMGVAATVAATTLAAGISHTAATYEWMGVALAEDGKAKFMRLTANGRKTYESAWQNAFVTEDTLLTPWVFVQNRSAANRTCLIDRLLVYQRDYASN